MTQNPKSIQNPSDPHMRNVRSAFSLVELVIAVVIIGIIAAIAIPRISSAVSRTGENSLMADLSSLRRAIDTYAAEHNGVFPGANADGASGAANSPAAFNSQLTMYSSETGVVSATKDAGHSFGPYLRMIPPLPVGDSKGSNTVAIDTTNSPPLATGGGEGWVYNPLTGEIIANSDDANLENTRAYDEY